MLRRWDAAISRDVLLHWFNLMRPDGWIPREQVHATRKRKRERERARERERTSERENERESERERERESRGTVRASSYSQPRSVWEHVEKHGSCLRSEYDVW